MQYFSDALQETFLGDQFEYQVSHALTTPPSSSPTRLSKTRMQGMTPEMAEGSDQIP